ncbi:MAG: response regulator [Dehalococcoidia bacterium]|nr:response regulator [Dehalococcoidia bacterium]
MTTPDEKEKPITLLIVEDNPADARLVRKLLKETPGIDCRDKYAVNLADGLELLRHDNISVVLLDLNLPDCQGIDTLMTLKNEHVHTPVVVMTDPDDEKTTLEALKMGAQDYLVKGRIDGHVLLRAMRYAIGRKQSEDAILKSKMLLQNVIDSTPDWIYAKDPQHRFVLVNRTFAESQHVQPQDMIGRPDTDFFSQELCCGNPAKGITGFHTDDDQALSGKVLHNLDNLVSWGDGSLHVYDTSKIPLYDESGNAFAVLGYGRDITRRHKAENELAASYSALQKTLRDSINAMARIVDLRDPYTAGHQQKVARLAGEIAREMGMDDAAVEHLVMASTVHDIGKMYVPADILTKPGRLSDLEWEIIKTHSQGGFDILAGIEFSGSVALTVLQHHERLDGSGYPNGLKGGQILPEAKILAVADVVEAMASHRPYRPSLGIEKALNEIERNKGTLYDPAAVDTCLGLFRDKAFSFNTQPVTGP